MRHLDLLIELIDIIAGIAATTATVYVYSRHRTKLLRNFAILNGALFCLALGFALSGTASAMLWLVAGSAHESEVHHWTSVLDFVSLLARNVGIATMTIAAPRFTASIYERQASAWLQRESLGAAAALIILFIAFLTLPRAEIYMVAGMGLFFLNLAACLGYAVFLGRERRVSKYSFSGSPLFAVYAPTLRRFFILTTCFIPLFVADIVISNLAPTPPIALVRHTSLPLYFLLVNIGLISLLRKGLDHPPLLEGDKVSDFGKATFGLTDREAEVLEYILDGYTIKDLASVLAISPKTAENHLYNVYQKVGVTNRIQLFQAFNNQRRRSEGRTAWRKP